MAEPAVPVEPRGHEPDVPRLRGIAIGGGAVLVLVLSAILVAGVMVPRAPTTQPGVPPDRGRLAGVARLQPSPQADIAAYRRDKAQLLHGYAWVDRSHRIVRIPIEAAMRLLVQQQARSAPTR